MTQPPTMDAAPGFICRYCGSKGGGKRVSVREMYFGSRERFDYIECGMCRSLSIERIPSDLGRHYAQDYGAHRSVLAGLPRARGLRQWARILRTEARLGRMGAVAARWVEGAYHDLSPYPWRWLRMADVGRHSAILDVGCGNGSLLRTLYAEGFTNLRGIDRFYPGETRLPGLEIGIGDVFDVHGRFDLVMLHHSLEHMSDPLAVLSYTVQLLRPTGVLMIRVPLADCVAHREFGADWFQIDAPRHLAIPSVHGMFAIGERLGLRPLAVDFDSSEKQFEVSEGYRNDVPLTEQRRQSSSNGGNRSEVGAALKSRAAALNVMHLGDMAAFLFRPSS